MDRPDVWNADRYASFKGERSRPFFDLLDLVEPRKAMRVVDLGCGTGELTAAMHARLDAAETVGIDSSAAMLENAPRVDGITFRLGDLRDLPPGSFDLVFSNAALQWTPDHEALLAKLTGALRERGQIAIQVPDNGTHPYQQLAQEMELELEYAGFPSNPVDQNVLPPEQYAIVLYNLGFERITVRLNVYLHEMPSREGVFEWAQGTYLNHYRQTMPQDLAERFVSQYRTRLQSRLPDDRPYLFTFRRILMHAVRTVR